ncbi:metalloreductase [Dissoconium aciculare CBS 342.82]|uniref:Metalloreductase n=1 Tax=Dissoconium aciculare CBS 342.82 TaxID=1314786 RepID=A0A6J3LVJ1_9PEZI|nr:metalloreductase [Dissoconium aciculare CBS 342.82]KAF1819776.1 metalloreductase [Dissoconium aciculare CBS 342.82]
MPALLHRLVEDLQVRDTTNVDDILHATSPALPFVHGLSGVNQDQNYLLINVACGAFMLLLVITFAYRWLDMSKAYLRFVTSLGTEGDQRYWQQNHTTFWPWLKRNLLYAPLFRVRHNREIQLSKAISIGTLPSRFHTVLLGLYLASNLAYCLILDWRQPNQYAVIAELRGRSGILAAFNLIPTVLFALRNNPLISLLSVSYDTFNLLHRWCARMVILESIIHTACFLVNNISAGTVDGVSQVQLAFNTSVSYQWGMVASCVFVFMGVASLGPIRHAFYEFFINSHRLLACIALIGVLIHLAKATLPQVPWIIICFVLWSAEWAWRFCRIVYYNISRTQGFTKVTVEALPGEACRVTFHLARPMSYRPGCHVHAYLPAVAWHSSHPFSIAWADARASTMNPRTEKSLASLPGEVPNPTTIPAWRPKATSISLITKARSGMTRNLYDRAVASTNGIYTTRGLIEGPYGGNDPLDSYGTVVLFAGGVGITHCLGYIRNLLTRRTAQTCAARRILLVWSIPVPECLEWVHPWMDAILRLPGRRDALRIHIYITKPRRRQNLRSESGAVRMLEGRCNPTQILRAEMKERVGAMAVAVCGPGAFADSVRAAAREVVTEGAVDFVEEGFTY